MATRRNELEIMRITPERYGCHDKPVPVDLLIALDIDIRLEFVMTSG